MAANLNAYRRAWRHLVDDVSKAALGETASAAPAPAYRADIDG